MADRTAKAIGENQFNMRRLVHTESAFFASKGQKDCYEFLGVEEFEVLGTLDNLTCEKFGAMDGKHFPMSEWKIGKTAHPFHPFCRCTTVPYFDSELFTDVKSDTDVSAELFPLRDEFTEDEERVARDENGESYYTKAKTFEEWEKECVKEEFTWFGNGGIIKIGKNDIINKNIGFRTLADPMREIMGAAEESNPMELASIIADLESSGVGIKYRNGTMGYFPPSSPGKPGDIVIEKGASFSAWSHEYKHFCDDRKDGYLGMRVLEDTQKCIQREKDAYQVEIELAKKLPSDVRDKIIKRLVDLRDNEVKRYE